MMDKSANIPGRIWFWTATTVPAELELLGPDRLWDIWARLWVLVDLLLGMWVAHFVTGMSDKEEDFSGDFFDDFSSPDVN